ncbi:MAG: HD domain-containing phosphohydrolase [Candidatus Omnitrophota bacterium]|nr:HD domain-containing phosphohydrolase [Candidatus Omnitrophota bacterium]
MKKKPNSSTDSARKKTEEQTAFERDMFKDLLDNIPDAIYFKDRKNRIMNANKFYVRGLGLPLEGIVGKSDFDFFPREQAKQMFADDNYVLRTGRPIVGKIEKTLLRNGEWNQVITTKMPLCDRKGAVAGTMGITRDMTAYANSEAQRFKMLMNTILVLGRAVELRDPYTFKHIRNVAIICEQIAKTIGWDENRVLGLRLAAEMHDLGKISIPLDILNKPGKLNDLEFQLIKSHVENCCQLIKGIDFPFPFIDIISQHHERLDGSGYPKGLKGDEIGIEARILAVSDVLESMISHRPYRPALGKNKALSELKEGCGIKYDREIVSVAIDIIGNNREEILEALN